MSNIHHEVLFAASPARVYRAIVDPVEFAKMTGAPAAGAESEGGSFSVFGGHITGRHVELVPNTLIVQAWRAKTWPAGRYSLVRFELRAEGDKTRLVFDHDGFAEDQKEHLSKGWEENYWEPIRRHLG